MVGRKKILIIDDHPLFADGMALFLSTRDESLEIDIVNEASSSLENTKILLTYDLILIDLHMPKLSGFAFLSAVRLQNLPIRVAVISGTENKDEIERAISSWACGFIPKDSPSAELFVAVRKILDGHSYLPEKWLGEVDWLSNRVPNDDDGELSQRQLEVLSLIGEGLQNKQIASVMGISLSGVKGHIENIFKHLNVNNRTACAKAARDAGLI